MFVWSILLGWLLRILLGWLPSLLGIDLSIFVFYFFLRQLSQ